MTTLYLCDGGDGGARRRGTAAILRSQLRHGVLRLVGSLLRFLEVVLNLAVLGQVDRRQLLLSSQPKIAIISRAVMATAVGAEQAHNPYENFEFD